MLIKFTYAETGNPFYLDSSKIVELQLNAKGTLSIQSYEVREKIEDVARAVNTAKLLSLPEEQRKQVIQQLQSDSSLSMMLPVALMFGMAMSA